ncbi:hypothetical protein EJB05_12614, partial [Eragrostis curvula]
ISHKNKIKRFLGKAGILTGTLAAGEPCRRHRRTPPAGYIPASDDQVGLLLKLAMAMQLRSGRRLVSPPPPAPRGDLRRGRPRRIQEDDGEDRISGLPEELVLDILGRFGSTRQAARTSALSRRWRDLWTELRVLDFGGLDGEAVETALARVRPNLNRLKIRFYMEQNITHARITSLLRAADRLAPAELDLDLEGCSAFDDVPFELPCFGRATSIVVFLRGLYFTVAPAGEFSSLEHLDLTFDRCHITDLTALIPRCPRLRKLSVRSFHAWASTNTNKIAVESTSLEELLLSMHVNTYGPADVAIVAPELRKFSVSYMVHNSFTVSQLSVPKLEESILEYTLGTIGVGFGYTWWLQHLRMETQCNARKVLSLMILPKNVLYNHLASRSFAQEVALLPVNQFSVLELSITTGGHVFGPLLLHLLQIRTSLQRLKLVLKKKIYTKCSENCDCDEDGNWRNEQISLPDLQDVEIQGFDADDDEVAFLQLVFRSAPILKRMDVQLSDQTSPSDEGCQKLCSIFEENASVKCNVYDQSVEKTT